MKYTINDPFRMTFNGQEYMTAGKISVETEDSPVPVNESDAKYMLNYTKLSGETELYYIREIVEMTSTHLKANTSKGYRLSS